VKDFDAVLLAGGESIRMGTNKALIGYHGVPLWRFQMEKLIQLGPDQLFFSTQLGMDFPAGPWTFVHDRTPNLGPLGGLQAALRLARVDFLVTLAVDMPAMTAAFLKSLLEKAGPAGVVPRLEGFYHGAVAVYPIKILPLAEQVLAGNDRSLQHLIHEAIKAGLMAVEEIEPAKSGLFENWNLPDDVKRTCIRLF
jgi:molybdenum cofactor guanylyltransferase